jgi:S-DNA-T family DNA segregation ATPase FtsK/SpoIIIE
VRVWTVLTDDGPVDVEVTALDDEPLASVLAELSRALDLPVEGLWAGSSQLSSELSLEAPELRHGTVLGLNRPAPRPSGAGSSSAVALHVAGGPDAGRVLTLSSGRHVIGRGAAASIQLADPDVSRRHVAVRVGGGAITIADLGSTNGTRLDEEEVGPEGRSWPREAALHIGASTLVLAGPGARPAALEPAPGGRLRLRPTGRLLAPPPEAHVEFPRRPDPPPRRRLAWVAVALPAVAGLLMAWLLRTPMFLFFALLSPLVALGTWLSERWAGRRGARQAAAEHAVALLEARQRVAAAVRADVRATDAARPDLATLVLASGRRTGNLWSRQSTDDDALTVRIGTGPGSTRVSTVQADGTRTRETAPHVPVEVDLRLGGGLGVVGPRDPALRVTTGVLAQLVALHPPGDLEVLLLLDSDRVADWTWARWLPHLDPAAVLVRPRADRPGCGRRDEQLYGWFTGLVARRRAAAAGGAFPGWLVVVADGEVDPRTSAALRRARDIGIVVLALAPSPEQLPVQLDAALRLSGETAATATLQRQGLPDHPAVTVDGMARHVAATLARDLAGLLPATSAVTLPRRVRLVDLPGEGLHLGGDGTVTGSWTRDRRSLGTSIGRSTTGVVRIDLCRDGPHALVAGTTGAGKSELLQTLIAGLALNHPPDRCSFFLVDYKGGAAFAEAAHLPHTVGMVTDLDPPATARALRSLTAELTRREAVLARHGVSDLADLPESVDLARLVIVVDEFATLALDLPEFVPGLVGIAQRGRSLGVHLILATQRPSGVVSPEIRANCSLRICLRTTDEADSRDVLGTPQAAQLPVDVPGRAFLRTGAGVPREVQIARVSGTTDRGGESRPSVRRWQWPGPGAITTPRSSEAETDLARLAAALRGHVSDRGSRVPHRPWCPPLPDLITPADISAARASSPDHATRPGRLHVGLVDLPDAQIQTPLELDLADGGAWLVVGGPRSGRSTFLRTVLAEAVHDMPPDRLHVHVIDAGGALAAESATVPHAGTVIAGDDPLRAVRLVDRLGEEIAARRSSAHGGERPLLLLLIDGVEALCAVLDDADPARGSAALFRLIREGAAVGLTSVVTADRAVPGGRLAAAAERRLVLPLADTADYAVAGIPARAVPGHRPPGRALLGEDARECQLAVPRELPPVAPTTSRRAHDGLLRIQELPPDPELPLPRCHADGRAPAGARSALTLPIGPGGDEGDVLTVDLLRLGGLLVAGPPGSGRSSALDAFARHLTAVGAPVLRLAPPAAETRASQSRASTLSRAAIDDVAAVRQWVEELAGEPGVVIVDDVGTPPDGPALAALPAPGTTSGVALLAASSTGQLSAHFQGPVAVLRRARSGLLLCPGPGDAELLGTRLPRTPVPVRPGSGWLITGHATQRVQVARRRDQSRDETVAGQRSSSAGPISWLAYQASSCPSA